MRKQKYGGQVLYCKYEDEFFLGVGPVVVLKVSDSTK